MMPEEFEQLATDLGISDVYGTMHGASHSKDSLCSMCLIFDLESHVKITMDVHTYIYCRGHAMLERRHKEQLKRVINIHADVISSPKCDHHTLYSM